MELLKIGPLADRAFKQVLPIIKDLHAGRNRQRIDLTMYPAVMLRNSFHVLSQAVFNIFINL